MYIILSSDLGDEENNYGCAGRRDTVSYPQNKCKPILTTSTFDISQLCSTMH